MNCCCKLSDINISHTSYTNKMSSILPVLDKINLVLDFDETMVYVSPRQLINTKIFPIIIHDYSDTYYVYVRPGLEDLLNSLKKTCNLYIWTASLKRYLYLILDNMGIDRKIFNGIFTRKHCVDLNDFYTKDLTKYFTEYQLSQTILIDNCILNFIPQPSNAFYIKSFRGSEKDNYLQYIPKLIKHLKNKEDIRPYLKEINNVRKYIADYDYEKWYEYKDRQYEMEIAYTEDIKYLCNVTNKYPKLF